MTDLLGTSVTLEEMTEAVSKLISDSNWLEGVDTAPILAHDFSDPRGRLEIEARHSSNRIQINGSQVTATTHYSGHKRLWLSNGKILDKLPDYWRRTLKEVLQAEAPELVKSHELTAGKVTPHEFIAAVQWKAPAFEGDNAVRRMVIFGPMEGPEQAGTIMRLVRESIAAEASTIEEAIERAKNSLLNEVHALADGRKMPTIIFEDNKVGVRAQMRLITTDLSIRTLIVHRHYPTPVISNPAHLYSGDQAELERHFRYCKISERQNGRMRITALAAWLLSRPNGTVKLYHRKFDKNLLDRGTVYIGNKKGRIEATFRSRRMVLMTGKIELTLAERYPETVIASMKGKPLSALLGLEGISDHLIIRSLAYQGGVLIGQLRDNSQFFVDGEILIDDHNPGESTCT